MLFLRGLDVSHECLHNALRPIPLSVSPLKGEKVNTSSPSRGGQVGMGLSIWLRLEATLCRMRKY
jgi:hypothetical protein